MATQGPNNVNFDASSAANFKVYAGDGTGGGTGLASALNAANWTRTSDGNQIVWATLAAAPFATSAVYPAFPSATSATAGIPPPQHSFINPRGTWVTATTYNYLDVVFSDPSGGGTGASYILSREPAAITTNSSSLTIAANVATYTAVNNNFAAGDTIRIVSSVFPELNGVTYTINATPSGTSFAFNVTHGNVTAFTADSGQAFIVLTSATRPETDTKNYVAYNYEIWKTQDTQNAAISKIASGPSGGQSAGTTLYVSSGTIPGTIISPATNLWRSGFVVSVTGLSNASYNGTWTIQNSYLGETDSITAIQITANVITYTASNTLSVGEFVTVSGLSNGFGNISGTVTARTTTTFNLALTHANVGLTSDSGTAVANAQFTVVTNAADIAVTTDAGTATYTMQPIYLKIEHWASTNLAGSAAPWMRFSMGTSTDGLGNPTGNALCGTNWDARSFANNRGGYVFEDYFPTLTGQTTNTFKSIWSGESALNAGSRFGMAMWYNTSAGATQATIPLVFGVERARDPYGNAIDDYFTYLMAYSSPTQFPATAFGMRSVWKPNPLVQATLVSIDGSNNLTITYTTNAGYRFRPGAIVYLNGFVNSTFLNGQFVTVTSSPTATSFVATGITHAAYSSGDVGLATQSISSTTLTPIVGTGGIQPRDRNICSINTAATQLLNGNTGLLPIFPLVGYLGNPITQFMATRQADVTADGTITNSGNTGPTVYGVSNKPYFLIKDGGLNPFSSFISPSGSYAVAMRWE